MTTPTTTTPGGNANAVATPRAVTSGPLGLRGGFPAVRRGLDPYRGPDRPRAPQLAPAMVIEPAATDRLLAVGIRGTAGMAGACTGALAAVGPLLRGAAVAVTVVVVGAVGATAGWVLLYGAAVLIVRVWHQ